MRSSLNLMCEKLQRTISFASRFRINSFLQRWKAFVKLHNLTYFDFYHMLRCKDRKIVKNWDFFEVQFDLSLWKLELMIDETELISNENNEKFSWTLSNCEKLDEFQVFTVLQFHNYINNISISIILTTLKYVYFTE